MDASEPHSGLPPFDLILGSDTRSSLLAAAVDSFATKGFHATTTRDIAAAVGLSPASVYVHFSSKEELLYTISRAGHELTLRIVKESLASSDNPVDQLSAVVYDFTAYHAYNQQVARVVTNELDSLQEDHLEEVIGIRRAIQRLVRQLLETGIASNHFYCPNPRLTAIYITSVGIDVSRWYHEKSGWTPEEIASYYRDLALRITCGSGSPVS